MLFISRLKVRNFKSFRFVDVPLPKQYLCLAGPNGSGKCVDGNTEIFLADGTTAKIRELVEEAISLGHVEKLDDGEVARYDCGQEIFMLDTHTLKVSKSKIGAFVRRTAPKKMLKVRTRSGREIIATEYHPFFILDNETLRSIRADELETGKRIAIPRLLPVNVDGRTFVEFLDMFGPEDDIYVPYREDAAKFMLSKKGGMTWQKFAGRLGIPPGALISYINSRQAIRFAYLVRALRLCNASDFEVMQHVQAIKSDGPGALMRIPWQNSAEFCRFLGYLLAEGSVSRTNNQVRLTNASEDIINDYVRITADVFGLPVHVYRYKKGAYDAIINCVALRNLLVKLGLSYGGAGEKYVSDIVLKHCSNAELSGLLDGLYSGDGYVSGSSIEITLKSRKLIRAIEMALLRLGIVPRTKLITKRETKTGFTGQYLKINIFGTENFRVFSEAVQLTHGAKQERVRNLLGKKVNPNVDLLEANHLVKKTVEELGILVKPSKKAFPKLDAYCYNQCLPSRHGLKHLLSSMFDAVAVANGIQSQALAALHALADSDIFWDEIKSIDIMEPREKWVYDLNIAEHHNFIANGVFVHNSNLTDAIRFVLGESSLKSLRAKKVTDLIHSGSDTAEVTILFEGDEKLEVRRAIRKDGKIRYMLNGRKTTRTAILEALRKHNIDESGRNIIPQGEVQRIVNISSKERRQIIDAVAGISDFEDKKNEAMKELGAVEAKIREANVVLGEKRGFLDELGKEKEVALRYMDAKKKLNNAKGTLLTREAEKYEKERGSVADNQAKLNHNMQARQAEIAELDAKIRNVDAMRQEVGNELQLKRQTSLLIRKIEELKAAISSKKQLIEDRETALRKMDEENAQFSEDAKREKAEITSLEKEITASRKELSGLETEFAKYASVQESGEIRSLAQSLEDASRKERDASEQLLMAESEIKAKEELIQVKNQELEGLKASLGGEDEETKRIESGKAVLKGELASAAKEIEELFRKERELNAESAELDKKLLELREKYSILRVQASPGLANPALKYIQEVKDKGDIDGIHGTVAELIKFDTKYTAAVEAAAGSRLLYVVVDGADIAEKLIKLLKKTGNGRATFIPLREIRSGEGKPLAGFDTVSSVLKYPNAAKNAIDYVFGGTLLLNAMEDAKKVGIGNARMVTLEGEIYERAGIISGGKVGSSILATTQLAKIDSEINGVKEQKNAIMRELISLREEASRKRSEKSDIEIKIRTLDIEAKNEEEKLRAMEKQLDRKKQLEAEISEMTDFIKEKTGQRGKLDSESRSLKKRVAELNSSLQAVESKSKEAADENARKKTELASGVSSLRATVEGKVKELEIRKGNAYKREERTKLNDKERKTVLEKINELKRSMVTEGEELSKSEEKISSASKQIEQLYEAVKGYETDLQNLGGAKGKLNFEIEKLNRELGNLSVKVAVSETRLADTRAELANYQSFEYIETTKEELNRTIKESEELMASFGNSVNMAAVEMYDKKKADMEALEKSVGTLDGERNAVLSMIGEIDSRKKEAFFLTYDAVSDNFRKMFKHLNIGEGYIYLDRPNEPFESGLFIKLKRKNKDGRITETSMDSLSGGENSLVALMFIFSLQFVKPSPFYILDEADSALDKDNSKNLAHLVKSMASDGQFIVVSHNDIVMSNADAVLGVTRVNGVSKLVGVKLEQAAVA